MLAEHDGGDLPLPETVQGLIAARIDGLAPEEKALLQDASVIGKVFWPGALAEQRRAACCTRSSGRSSSGETAAPRSPARRSTPSSTHSCETSPTGRSPAPSAPRSTAGRRSGSLRSPATGPKTMRRCSPTTTARRSRCRRPRDWTRPLCASPRGGHSRMPGSGLSRSARARTAYELAYEALALTDEGDEELPALQLLAAYGGRDLAEADVTGLLDEAVDGFLAHGDTGRAAETAQVLAREFFHRGDVARADEATARAIELARSVPLSTPTARAIARPRATRRRCPCRVRGGRRSRARGARLRRRDGRRPSRDARTQHDRHGSGLLRRRGRRRRSRAAVERGRDAGRGVRAGNGAQQPRQHARHGRPSRRERRTPRRGTGTVRALRHHCRHRLERGGARLPARSARRPRGRRSRLRTDSLRSRTRARATSDARCCRAAPASSWPGPDRRGCRRRRGSTGGRPGVEHRCADRGVGPHRLRSLPSRGRSRRGGGGAPAAGARGGRTTRSSTTWRSSSSSSAEATNSSRGRMTSVGHLWHEARSRRCLRRADPRVRDLRRRSARVSPRLGRRCSRPSAATRRGSTRRSPTSRSSGRRRTSSAAAL